MRRDEGLRTIAGKDGLEHPDEGDLQRGMQKQLRLIDEDQAIAADRPKDVDHDVREQALTGTEVDRLAVLQENDPRRSSRCLPSAWTFSSSTRSEAIGT